METLFAVLILAVGLTLVVRSLGSSFNILRISEDTTQAMLLLEERMWDLEAKGSITPGTSSGTFPQQDGKFQWQVSATSPNALDLCETKVTVFWKQRERLRVISIVTYLKAEGGS